MFHLRMTWSCPVCGTVNHDNQRKCTIRDCRHPGGPASAWQSSGKDTRSSSASRRYDCHVYVTGPTAPVARPRYRHGANLWLSSGAHDRPLCRLVVSRNAARWIDFVAGHKRPCRGLGGHNWRGIPCVASGMGPLCASDDARLAHRLAKPARTRCSRTWWQRIDFVAIPEEWFAAVKRAEVESSVALPGTGGG